MAEMNPQTFSIQSPGGVTDLQQNGYRPSQWGDQSTLISARTFITASRDNPYGDQNETLDISYFFDAVIRAEHSQAMRITEHPVQTGANIVDHAYLVPATLMLEIGMSDVMDSMIQGQYSGAYTKSVQAYQTLLALQAKRNPLRVTTRLNTYENMVIEELRTPDDYRTLYGLKCMVTLRQIITSQISTATVAVSARSQVTEQAPQGNTQPAPLPEKNKSALKSLQEMTQ